MKHSLLCAALLLGCGGLLAQTMYRITGPDGRVTFSDVPPVDAKTVVPLDAGGSEGNALATLPYGLRQVATKFPVVLYTGADCEPCGTGRALLLARGVPFNEKTVTTSDDLDGLKRLVGEPGLPVLTVGNQQLKGFSDANWSQYLDVAGYPARSQLPVGYRNPAPSPLASPKAPVLAPSPAPRVNTPPPAAPAANPNNPAGLQF